MTLDLFQKQATALIEAGKELHRRGWVPATSGNLSARLDNDRIAITVSGRHKGKLGIEDIMRADLQGQSLDDGKQPSAETLLHTQLYQRYPNTGAVLHTHSLNATLASRVFEGNIVFSGYELLKAFPGFSTHECTATLPVFANDQDIPRLAARVEQYLQNQEILLPGYLIAGHGLYAWGHDVENTMNMLEAFEYLLTCELKLKEISG